MIVIQEHSGNTEAVIDVRDIRISSQPTPIQQQIFSDYQKKIEDKISELLDKDRSPFTFERSVFGIDSEEQKKALKIAHEVRQCQQKEGRINEIVLGNVYGWEELRVGSPSGLDIRRCDGKYFVELKNKHNTMNSSSRKAVIEKLVKWSAKNPETTCILGIVNPKNGKGYQKEIQQDGECIKELGGEELFKLVFGKHYATYIEIAKKVVSDNYEASKMEDTTSM
jgi:hypothetical protein